MDFLYNYFIFALQELIFLYVDDELSEIFYKENLAKKKYSIIPSAYQTAPIIDLVNADT